MKRAGATRTKTNTSRRTEQTSTKANVSPTFSGLAHLSFVSPSIPSKSVASGNTFTRSFASSPSARKQPLLNAPGFSPLAAARRMFSDEAKQFKNPSDEIVSKLVPKLSKARYNKINWDDFESYGSLGHPADPNSLDKLNDIITKTKNGYTIHDYRKIEMPRLKPGRSPPHGWHVNHKGECVPVIEELEAEPDLVDPDLYREPLHDRIVRHVSERSPVPLNDTQKKALYEVTSTGTHLMYERDPDRILKSKKMTKAVKDKYLTSYEADTNVDLSFEYANLSPFNKRYRFVNDNPQAHAFMDLPRHKLKFRKQTRPVERYSGPSMDTSFLSYSHYKSTRGE